MPHKTQHGEIFDRERSLLIGLAYRMLGQRCEAEDAVQDAFLRWMRADISTINNPRAWLIRTTSRICIDRLRSLKRQRETYDGPWLPEPWMEDDPHTMLEADESLAESLRLAFLLMLEQMSAQERAAFLLREAFDLPYQEIGSVLEKSEVACRQLVSRAKRRIDHEDSKDIAKAEEDRLMDAFMQACASGDIDGLKTVLAKDVSLRSDAGGKALAARNIIYSNDNVARFLLGILAQAQQRGSLKVERALVNQAPGLLLSDEDGLQTVLVLEGRDGHIKNIYMQRNPDKLAHLYAISTPAFPS